MPADLVISIKGKDEASNVVKAVRKETGDFKRSLEDVGKVASGFLAASAIQSGLGKVSSLLKDSTKAAADDAASQARLQKAIENTGASWGAYGGKLDGVIKRGQQLGFSDDQTRDSLSLLAAQTGDTEEAVKRYALAQDLARGANIDVVTASKLLGKVTEGNVSVLNRYGISVKKGATEQELFAAVYEKFNGQAQTFADTTAGKMERFNDRMGELKESMGAALVPVLDTMLKLPEPIQAAAFATGQFAPEAITLAGSLGQVALAANAGGTALVALRGAAVGSLAVLGPLGLAIGAAYGFQLIYNRVIGESVIKLSSVEEAKARLTTATGLEREAIEKALAKAEARNKVDEKAKAVASEAAAAAESKANADKKAADAAQAHADAIHRATDKTQGYTTKLGDLKRALLGLAQGDTQETLALEASIARLDAAMAHLNAQKANAIKLGHDTTAVDAEIKRTQIQRDLVASLLDVRRKDLEAIALTKVAQLANAGAAEGLTTKYVDLKAKVLDGAKGFETLNLRQLDVVESAGEIVRQAFEQAQGLQALAKGFDSVADEAGDAAWNIQNAAKRLDEFLAKDPKGLFAQFARGARNSGSNPEGRQLGGSVSAGVPYWVGETGRKELFVPSEPGRVIPESQLRGRPGNNGFVFNNFGPLTVTNIGQERDVERTVEDIAASYRWAMKARGVMG